MSPRSWYARLIFLQDELLGAKAIVLYVRRPVQHARIKVESLQSTVTAHFLLHTAQTSLTAEFNQQ